MTIEETYRILEEIERLEYEMGFTKEHSEYMKKKNRIRRLEIVLAAPTCLKQG